MYKLLPALIQTMGNAYPELAAQQELIGKVMKEEEDSFLHTLETGIRLLEKKMGEAKAENKKILNGTDAFMLYDTYGFPLDLTELILRENDMQADIETFHVEMQKQKDRARNAATIETDDWIVLQNGETEFVGYDFFECDAAILRYRKIKQKNKELYQIVLDRTPCYAEMGGQVGDSGWLVSDTENIPILDTKRENNLPVHLVAALPADVTVPFTAKVDRERRIRCECNHSGTHLLHEALRETLGIHVEQKGSYVSPESLRFDFSHFQKLTTEEIRNVEKLVNERIRANIPLEEHRSMPIAQAREMGAMALFSEKYGEEVRVVKFGTSVEFCGGTHIPSSGMIGSLYIVEESSIAAGVRRIEAVTAQGAEKFFYKHQDVIHELRALMNNVPNLAQNITKTIEENAELKKQLTIYLKEKVASLKKRLLDEAVERNGTKLFLFKGNGNLDAFKDLAFQIKYENQGKICFVAGITDKEKCMLMVMLSDELVAEGLNASQLVKEASRFIEGGGGGQPHFATAGGKNVNGVGKAIDAVLEMAGLK
jgi:alanyl-tRNA synthetase